MIDITGCLGIVVFAGKNFDSVAKMAIRNKPAIEKKKYTATNQQYKKGSTPCVVGKFD